MIVLSIDTSHPDGSVCLSDGGEVMAGTVFGADESHLVELGRCVDRALEASAKSPADISRVALVKGPGSFTGLRIGMAYVKGLAAALDVEIVTINTLELLALGILYPAAPAPPPERVIEAGGAVCPMVDARKGEVYAAVYARSDAGDTGGAPVLKVLVPPCARAPETFLELAEKHRPFYTGSGTVRYRDALDAACAESRRIDSPEDCLPSTHCLAGIAHKLTPLTHEEVLALEPYYIRSSDAILKPLKPIESHEKHHD